MVGLKLARELKAALDTIVRGLEVAHDLPERVPPPREAQDGEEPVQWMRSIVRRVGMTLHHQEQRGMVLSEAEKGPGRMVVWRLAR